MAETFGIACHELVSLDFRCGSKPEVNDGHENVGSWGISGRQFRAAGLPGVANNGHPRIPFQHLGSSRFSGRVRPSLRPIRDSVWPVSRPGHALYAQVRRRQLDKLVLAFDGHEEMLSVWADRHLLGPVSQRSSIHDLNRAEIAGGCFV